MTPQIHYVIAAWLGRRAYMPGHYDCERMVYLNTQLEALVRFKSTYVEKVAIVLNQEEPDGKEFQAVEECCRARFPQLNLEFHARENRAISYGAWIHYYKACPDATHYLLMEDDYAVGRDHYDTLLLDVMQREEVDYVCGVYAKMRKYLKYQPHVAMSCGLMSAQGMAKMSRMAFSTRRSLKLSSQLQWSNAVRTQGLRITDVSGVATVSFRAPRGVVWFFGENAPEKTPESTAVFISRLTATETDRKRCLFRAL